MTYLVKFRLIQTHLEVNKQPLPYTELSWWLVSLLFSFNFSDSYCARMRALFYLFFKNFKTLTLTLKFMSFDRILICYMQGLWLNEDSGKNNNSSSCLFLSQSFPLFFRLSQLFQMLYHYIFVAGVECPPEVPPGIIVLYLISS